MYLPSYKLNANLYIQLMHKIILVGTYYCIINKYAKRMVLIAKIQTMPSSATDANLATDSDYA